MRLFVHSGQIELGVSQRCEERVGSTGRFRREVAFFSSEFAMRLVFMFWFAAVVLLLLLFLFTMSVSGFAFLR